MSTKQSTQNSHISIVMGPRQWGQLFFLSVLWGGSFFFSKVALYELSPFMVVLVRVALAAFALNLVILARGHRMPGTPRLWGMFAVMGLLNNLIPFSLIFWGQTQISGSLAAILNATTPLWTVLLANFFTRDERLSGRRLTGVLIGISGVVIVIGPDALRGLGGNVLAQLAVLGATLSYAFASIFGRRFAGVPPLYTATGQVTSTTVLMMPIVLFLDPQALTTMPSLPTIGALVGLALLSTALAYIVYFSLLASAGATNLLLVTMLIPVSALLLGATFLNEQLSIVQCMGLVVIGAGLIWIDGRAVTWAHSRLHPQAGQREQHPEDYSI